MDIAPFVHPVPAFEPYSNPLEAPNRNIDLQQRELIPSEALPPNNTSTWQKLCVVVKEIFRRVLTAIVAIYGTICNILSAMFLARSPAVIRPTLRSIRSAAEENTSTNLTTQISDEKCMIIERLQMIQTESGSVTVIKEAPPIRNLVLQGGGAKGIVYPTFLRTLDEKTHILKDLREIAGSSAGAMMASMIAVGVPLERMETLVAESNVMEQMTGTMDESLNLGAGILSAGNVMSMIWELSKTEAAEYFNEIKDDEVKLTDIRFLNGCESFMERALRGFERGVTFEDLKFLHALNPEKFKLLNVTGFERRELKTIYFNAETYPDMPIHEAVRVSMAIPIVIKTVIVDGKTMSDGGEGSNVPVEVFSTRSDYNPAETMALVFSRKGKIHHVQHEHLTEDGQRKAAPGWLKQFAVGAHYAENKKCDYQKIYELGVNVLVVPHGSLKSLSFLASNDVIEDAKIEAHEAAFAYAMERRLSGFHEVYPSRETALASV